MNRKNLETAACVVGAVLMVVAMIAVFHPVFEFIGSFIR